jgi:hypothetical protein
MQTESSPRDIQLACHKAAQYRRQLAIKAGEPAGNLAERISISVAREPRPTNRPNWVEVGQIFDSVVGEALTVFLNVVTSAVQVERPQDITPPIPKPSMPALIYNIYGPKHNEADPRYRYFFEGREYAAAEAELIAAERKSVKGWTWELKEP